MHDCLGQFLIPLNEKTASGFHFWNLSGDPLAFECDKKGDGIFWFFDKQSGSGQGRRSEDECRKAIEIRAAFDVLEAAGVEDAHSYDWHLWCDSAEHIVQEIVQREKRMREAQAEVDP